MAEQGIKKRDTQPGGRFELMSRPQKARRWKNKLYTYMCVYIYIGGASGKEPACQCRRLRDVSSIPGSGGSPGGGHGNPLQYSCLGNPMDRGAWQSVVHSVTKSHIHT